MNAHSATAMNKKNNVKNNKTNKNKTKHWMK